MKLRFYMVTLLFASTSLYAMKPIDAFKKTTKEEIIKELDSSDAWGFQDVFNRAEEKVRKDADAFIPALKEANIKKFQERTKELNQFEEFCKLQADKKHDWKGFKESAVEFSLSGILLAITSKLYTNFNKHMTPKNIIDKIFQPLTSSKLTTMVTFGVCVAGAVVLFNKALQAAKPSWYYQDTLKQQEAALVKKHDAHPSIDSFISNEKMINKWKDGNYVGFKAYTFDGKEKTY